MKFSWPESARAELRAVDRETAIRILLGLTTYCYQFSGSDVFSKCRSQRFEAANFW